MSILKIVLLSLLVSVFIPDRCPGCIVDLRVLLVGSHVRGVDDWVTRESLMIENLLEFNGIPYDFFDIGEGDLGQADLDAYDGVILEGSSMRFCATETERSLLAQSMEAGAIAVLLSRIDGTYELLNSTLYSAIDVWVDGLDNLESDVHLGEGASAIYDYWTNDGFVVVGGRDGKHVGVAVKSLGTWAAGDPIWGSYRVFGVELALSTWMQKAFGVDARVTLPVISLRLDDAQTTDTDRHEEVIAFIDENKHRIRASGFLVTDVSAHQGSDSMRRHDEQIISRWGSMSLHGKDHGTVGAEGEDRGYETQYNDMNIAVGFLDENFSRHKRMKACPENSWNEATLHAMFDNGIYYHSAAMRKSNDYQALYKSLLDVASAIERKRIYVRGAAGLLGFYPLVHADETGEARIYSADWGPVLSAAYSRSQAQRILRSRGLDWWTPVLVAAHFQHPGAHGANNDPEGWIRVMATVMDSVAHDSYAWRRWVDSYDFLRNVERFDRALTVNSISIAENLITYDLTADRAIRFMTLKADRAGHSVKSVVIDGTEHCYFGENYVHLPEIDGNTTIEVMLTSQGNEPPHVRHIDPSGVVESAGCVDGRLDLYLSGEFEVTARIAGSDKAFRHGKTTVFEDGTEHLKIDVSYGIRTMQVELSLIPSSDWVEVAIDTWETAGTYYKKWSEVGASPNTSVEHTVGTLIPNSSCVIQADGSPIDTCIAGGDGEITFVSSTGCSIRVFEVIEDSAAVAGIPCEAAHENEAYASDEILASCPNPFRSKTLISYDLARPGRVNLSVHSVNGRLVSRLIDGFQRAGAHSVLWDGLDVRGSPVSPGIYFCRLEAGDRREACRIILIR